MRTPAVVLASLLVSQTARAEKVGVVVTGEATLQPQVAAQLERWLHDRGRDIVPGALEPEAINTLIDCFVLEDLGCARSVVDVQSKANNVVFTRAEMTQNADGTRNIAVTGYWFQKDHDVIAERRTCEKCSDKMLRMTVDELMLSLVHDPPPPLPREETAVVETSEEDSSMRRLLPYGLMGAGGAMLLTGLVMIAVDEDANPMGAQSPRIRDTATGGTVLGLAGAAALGAGIYLWRRDRQSAPVAAVGSDGGYIGWAGRF